MSDLFFTWITMTVTLKDFEQIRHELARPLLLLKGSRGILACGYLNVATFDKTAEAAAIVTGVVDHEQMLAAPLIAVSQAAQALGLRTGMTGAEALAVFK
ncbi:conserved hypotheticalprotein [Bordetella avium 197N]|uniref:Conserved hypotheticalprotein n=2 Tax=Bordetella avium TaxID=521 RepID=Q2L0X2_BORA1|nr:YunC family protein [Bordetella avium]CAJ49403.1 conserved hypotheticalprotein [Bordetella avium 197N]